MASILVVDDDLDTRDLLSRYLAQGGHNAVHAANGWEALIALDEQPVDLILLDIMMPGMDGATFLNIMRNAQHHRKTPVVVVSALAPETVQEQVSQLRIAEIVPKKADFFADLLQLIDRHLNEEQPASTAARKLN